MNKELKPLAESLSQNNVEKFVKEYSTSPPVSDDINFQSIVNSLGYFYLENKEAEKAMAIFKLNVDQNPSAWNVYYSLAEAYFRSGDFDQALFNYQKALTLNIDNQWANNDRVKLIIARIKRKMKN